MKTFITFTALCVTLTAIPAFAESTEENASAQLELEDLEVVSTPIIAGNVLDDFAGIKTVISETQIDDLSANDLGSALRTAPGVNISRYNHIGSFGGGAGGAVFIRGMGSSRPGAEIQTLFDGIPVYNPIWNHPLLDLLPIGSAQAVEIFKGAQPLEFGNAFGAINIVPDRIENPGFSTELSTAYGSYNTLLETFEHGGKQGAFDYFIGQSYRTSDGHRDDAGGWLGDASLRLGYEANENWDLAFTTLGTDSSAKDPGEAGNPESKDGTYKTNAWTWIISAAHEYPDVAGSLKLYYNTGSGDWLDQAGEDDETLNDWDLYGIRAKESISPWKDGEILLGADLDYMKGNTKFTQDSGSESNFYSPTFSILSPYTGLSHTFGNREHWFLIPSAGIRHYSHSDFDSQWSPHAGIVTGYSDTELHFSYARGVSYPGLNTVVLSEQVIPTLGISWKDLEAEVVHHFEAGIRQAFGESVEADLTYFHDDGKNRYVIVPPPPPPPRFDNIEEFTIDGIETSLNYTFTRDLSLFIGATFLDTDPADLPYAPELRFSAGANYRFFENWHLSLDAEYCNDMHVSPQLRSANAENNEEVDSYYLLNSRLSYAFTLEPHAVRGEVFLSGENLTDENYEYRPGYPMPGINAMLGLRLSL